MPIEIRALMQDANDVDAIREQLEKQHMPSSRVLEITIAQVARMPSTRVIGDGSYSHPKTAHIAVRAVLAPSLCAEVPDVVDVILGAR